MNMNFEHVNMHYFDFSKKTENQRRGHIDSHKVKENESIFNNFIIFPSNNFSFEAKDYFPEFNFDYSNNKIPNGHSRYEYKGGRFDIFRHDDEYKSQFVYPDGFNRDDFNKHFPYLEPIINPEISNGASTKIKANGIIDENTIQGSTGDCWLISALYSMSSTKKGKEIIKNSITVNNDSSVTVTFGGVGVSYNISASEILKHNTDDNTEDAYSNGDDDVLAMELAVEKLWKDINSGKLRLNTKNEDILYTGNSYSGISKGGLPNQLMYYLTGVEPDEYYNEDLSNLSKNTVYSVLNNAYTSGSCALSFGIYGNNHSAKLTNGTTFEMDLGSGGHALSITDVQKDTVTFVNPWDTSTKYTMSWEEFSKLGIGYLCSSDMNKTNIYEEITDMSYSSANSYSTQNMLDNIFMPYNHSRSNSYNNNFSFFTDILSYIRNMFKSFSF